MFVVILTILSYLYVERKYCKYIFTWDFLKRCWAARYQPYAIIGIMLMIAVIDSLSFAVLAFVTSIPLMLIITLVMYCEASVWLPYTSMYWQCVFTFLLCHLINTWPLGANSQRRIVTYVFTQGP